VAVAAPIQSGNGIAAEPSVSVVGLVGYVASAYVQPVRAPRAVTGRGVTAIAGPQLAGTGSLAMTGAGESIVKAAALVGDGLQALTGRGASVTRSAVTSGAGVVHNRQIVSLRVVHPRRIVAGTGRSVAGAPKAFGRGHVSSAPAAVASTRPTSTQSPAGRDLAVPFAEAA
jgi:hypothetical protein